MVCSKLPKLGWYICGIRVTFSEFFWNFLIVSPLISIVGLLIYQRLCCICLFVCGLILYFVWLFVMLKEQGTSIKQSNPNIYCWCFLISGWSNGQCDEVTAYHLLLRNNSGLNDFLRYNSLKFTYRLTQIKLKHELRETRRFLGWWCIRRRKN